MKKNTVFYTVLLLAVTGIAVFALIQRFRIQLMSRITVRTTGILPQIRPDEIQEIKLQWRDTASTLRKKNGTWVLTERADFPANQKKVQSFLDDIIRMKALKIITAADRDTMNRLRVLPDTDKSQGIPGVRLTLKNAKEETLLDMTMGRGHFVKLPSQPPQQGPKTPDGRYFAVHKPDGKRIVLLSPSVFEAYHPTPGSWLQAPNLNALADTVSIAFREIPRIQPVWMIFRSSPSVMFTPYGTLQNVRVSPQAIRTLFSILTTHYVADAFPKAHYKNAEEPFASLTFVTSYGLKQTLTFRRIENVTGRVLFSVEADASKARKVRGRDPEKLAKEFIAGRENVYYEIPENLFNILKTPPYESTKKGKQ